MLQPILGRFILDDEPCPVCLGYSCLVLSQRDEWEFIRFLTGNARLCVLTDDYGSVYVHVIPGGVLRWVVYLTPSFLGNRSYSSGGFDPREGVIHDGRVLAMSFLSQASKAKVKGDRDTHAVDKEFKKLYPATHEFLTAGKDDEGKRRRGAAVTFFCEGGKWICVLKEREHGLDLWATADGFTELLVALEGRLTESVVDWKVSKRSK